MNKIYLGILFENMKRKISQFASIAVVILSLVQGSTTMIQAEVKVPHVFGNHMVFQREIANPVWGTA